MMVLTGYDDDGNAQYGDNGETGPNQQTTTPANTTPAATVPAPLTEDEQFEIKNRLFDLRNVFWKYRWRLPTKKEFDSMALGADGHPTKDEDWKTAIDAISKDSRSRSAINDHDGKLNEKVAIPSQSIDFSDTVNYGPGTVTGTQPVTTAPPAAKTEPNPKLAAWTPNYTPQQLAPPGALNLGNLTRQQGSIADPGSYTPGEVYRAPEYRAPDQYIQATPFGREEYGAATPFYREEFREATPFYRSEFREAERFGRPEYQQAAPFTAPTADDIGQDPGYQFRLSEGQKALERSGAARGITNTGGNMKGLLDYGQQAASQEYSNVYNRKLDAYNTNEANRAAAYNTNYFNAMAGFNVNEANRAGAYNTNYGNVRDTYAMNEANRAGAYATNYGNALGAYNVNEANRAGAYNTNYGNAFGAYNVNEANRANAYNTNTENQYRQYTTNALAQNAANNEAERRRSGAYTTNAAGYQNQQNEAFNREQQVWTNARSTWETMTAQERQSAEDRWNRAKTAAGVT